MLELLKAFPQGLTAQEVAEHLGKNKYTARNPLKRMVDEQAITCTKGVFTFHHQEESADAEGKTADLRGYRGYCGFCGADRAENEPVEGDERVSTESNQENHENHEAEHPCESNHGNYANHANHDNHGNHANRDSTLPSHRSPQEWEELIL